MADERAFLVEVVVDRAVNRGEFLKNSLRGPSVRIRRKRSIARSLRRNGWCEFSARLFNQRPTPRLSMAPKLLSAAPYEANRPVTIVSVGPCRPSDFLRNFASRTCSSTQGSVRQTKKVSESALPRHGSGRTKLTPLGERGSATILETLSADERAFLVEVVVDRAVNRGEFLQTSLPPKAKHRPLSSSEWLVRILDAIVQPAADLALVDGAQTLERDPIGSKPICHDLIDLTVATE